MYDVLISSLLGDIEGDVVAARSKALRGQPPGQPPQIAGGTPTGVPNAAPQQAMLQPQPGSPGGPTSPQNARALPQALGTGQKPPVGPSGPAPAPVSQGSDLQAREAELLRQRQEATTQQQASYAEPDRTASMQAYGQQQKAGQSHLMLALAAAHAGPEFQPVQAHFLKRATEAQSPMKMVGGTMTESGFIEDPEYKLELGAKRADAAIKQIDTALASNLQAQERRRLEAERMQHQTELKRFMGDIALQTANIAATTSRSNAAQASSDRRYAADTAAATAAGPGKATESERSSAGYLGRMEAVEGDIDRLAKAGGQPSILTKSLGQFGLGRAARPYLESTNQQQYRAVQEDWVRAKLRKESGASIPPDEMEREIETYFPQPGETDPEVVRIKRQARLQAQEQLRTSAGRVEATIAPKAGEPAAPAAAPRTATGPNGQKLQLVGGKWVPM